MLLLIGVTTAKAQSKIPGSLDLSTVTVDAGTGTLHASAGWDGSKIDWMTKGNTASIKFENTKDGAKYKIISYGGTNQSQVVIGFSIIDSKGNLIYDQTTEPYASGGFGDKKKNTSLPVTDAMPAGNYELALYYDNLEEGGNLTVNITQIEFIDADEYKEDEPVPTPGGVGLTIPCDLDLSKVDASASMGNKTLHYMADGDENCPRLDYPSAGDVATFKIKSTKAMAYKMSINYATPMDGIFMTWVIKDANGKEVYNQMFNLDPTGAPGDFWTIYKDFDNIPQTDELPAGDYTFIMYYNVDQNGNIVNGSYDGAENGNFHVNIKRITFANASGEVSFDINLATVDTSESQGNKTLHYMNDGDENCPRLDYPSAGDVAKFKINIPKEAPYKMSINYATPMDGMFMTWIITNAAGQEVYNQMFNLDPTGAPGDFWTIYKDFDNIPQTDVLAPGEYTLTMKYNIDQNGNIVNGSYDGAENGNFHVNIKAITFTAVGTSTDGEQASKQVIYSWEGAEAGANEKGGKATAANAGEDTSAEDINMSNAGHYVIRLRGAKDFSSYVVTLTLDQELAAGDKLAITAYRNKNQADKQSGVLARFDKGGEVSSAVTGLEFVNINADGASDQNYGTEPNTVTLDIPAEAAGSKKIEMTRAVTATNLFITKIQIIRGGETGIKAIETITVKPANNYIYNLAGQRVDENYKGVVIKNGKKYLNQ